jgi:indolepyruvate ferredoxin oxidoreductase beta subunit
MSNSCDLVVVGVGGQGVLSTARLLGRAATEADLEVRVGQIYGLSQRGGSVEATVRIGSVSTAFISQAEADVVVGLEPLETERALPWMSERTIVLTNRTPIVPTSLTLDRAEYPDLESVVEHIEAVAGVVHVIDGDSMARQSGDQRLLNMVMLGALAGLGVLPIPTDVIESEIQGHSSGPNPESRVNAFRRGNDSGIIAHAGVSSSHTKPVRR